MANNQLKIKTVFQGQDQVSPVMRKILKETKVTASGMKDAFSSVFSTIAKVGIGSAIAGIGAATYGAIKAFETLNEQAQKLDELGDSAERLGIGVEFLSDWGYAAKIAGSSSESLTEAITKLRDGIAKASIRSGKLYSLLNKPGVPKGVKASILGAKNTEDAFIKAMKAIENTEDPAKKTALAIALFGDKGAELIPLANKGEVAWRKLLDTARKLNPVTQQAVDSAGKYTDAVGNLSTAWEGLKNVFAGAFAEQATPFVEDLTNWISENNGQLAKEFSAAIIDMAKALKEVNWNEIGNTILNVAKEVFSMLKGIDDLYYSITGKRNGKNVSIQPLSAAPTSSQEAQLSPLFMKYKAWKEAPNSEKFSKRLSYDEQQQISELRKKGITLESEMARINSNDLIRSLPFVQNETQHIELKVTTDKDTKIEVVKKTGSAKLEVKDTRGIVYSVRRTASEGN